MYLKDPEFRTSSKSYTKRYYVEGNGALSLVLTSGDNITQVPKLVPTEGELNTPNWIVDADNASFEFLQNSTISITATIVYTPGFSFVVPSVVKLSIVDSEDNTLAATSQHMMSLNEAVNYSVSVSSTFYIEAGSQIAVTNIFASVGNAVNCSIVPRTDDNLPVSMIVMTFIHV